MIDVVMPQMGESIVEGTLTKWLKQPGERVERDEPLFEISTDKVDTEIPSPSAGTLAEVVVQEGQTVAINSVVGRIQDGAGAAAAAAPTPERPAAERPTAAPAPSPAPAPAEAPQAEAPPPPTAAEEMAGPLSPLVRKMAREHNIDLSKIRGTGAGGRITKHDLEAYLASSAGAAPAAAAAPPPPPSRAPQAPAPQAAPPAPAEIATIPPTVEVPPPTREPVPMPGAAPALRVEPMSIMRQRIAEHMVFSKRTSAHVTTVHKCDMTKIAKLRDRLKGQFQAQYGFGLTFLPFVVRAATAALRQYPIVNASIVNDTNNVYHRD